MNPSGFRIEEKKSADLDPSFYENKSKSFDSKSQTSYKSTHSSRSSVLQRAREYSRRIEEQQRQTSPSQKFRSSQFSEDNSNRRSKSLERVSNPDISDTHSTASRSKSASRAQQAAIGSGSIPVSRPSTRERAMASVRNESNFLTSSTFVNSNPNKKPQAYAPNRNSPYTAPSTPATSQYTSASSFSRSTRGPSATQSSSVSRSAPYQQQDKSQIRSIQYNQKFDTSSSSNRVEANKSNQNTSSNRARPIGASISSASRMSQRSNPDSPSRSMKSGTTSASQSQPPLDQQQQQQVPVVTPELLVDALSGHEDGLLAIAEKLMEHYDSGYDVMGEAIIDAFADVQKLFQHVVEAAHMEGAAFEASRREEEIAELRQQAALGGGDLLASGMIDESTLNTSKNNTSMSNSNAPTRHDEFIDQDVKDILNEAIRKGGVLRADNKHRECYELFEHACQNASSLLPVDSDHRGRLQLSLVRAESMSPDRSCAILRYAMDDVLRSGMRANRSPLPDPSKRAEVVLNRPRGHPSISGVSGQVMAGVIQSPDEALASLTEEMKEILSAPIYNDTPLQNVAKRFWAALADSQKGQQKNEERLEQNLGKLKVEFLLARSEWEEKLNNANEVAETFKAKYSKLKEQKRNEGHMDQAHSFATRSHSEDENKFSDSSTLYGSVRSGVQGKAGSVVSGVNGLAQQAKTIVSQMNNFNCSSLNERANESVVDEDYENDDGHDDGENERRPSNHRTTNTKHVHHHHSPHMSHRTLDTASTNSTMDRSRSNTKTSRSFRDYSQSPKRVDV